MKSLFWTRFDPNIIGNNNGKLAIYVVNPPEYSEKHWDYLYRILDKKDDEKVSLLVVNRITGETVSFLESDSNGKIDSFLNVFYPDFHSSTCYLVIKSKNIIIIPTEDINLG